MTAVAAVGVAVAATPAFAVADTLTLSRTHGPSGGVGSLIVNATVAATWSAAGGPLTVQFNAAATCPAAAATATPILTTGAAVVEVTGIAKPGSGTALSVTVPTEMALPPATTAPRVFSVCVYDETTPFALLAENNAGFTLDAGLTPDPTNGASGGGYPVTLTATNATFTANTPSAHVVQFQAKTASQTMCAAAPMGASTPTASNASTMTGGVIAVPSGSLQVPSATKMVVTVPSTLAQVITPQKVMSADYYVCVYKTSNSALLAETSNANVFNLNGNAALSTTSGSSVGGNPVSVTAASPIFTSGQTKVQLQSNSVQPACMTNYTTPSGTTVIDVPSVRFVTSSKLALTMPSAGLPTVTTAYNVCVYDTTNTSTSVLVSEAYGTYTVGLVPTVLSVFPATGPAEGGSTITVTGTNFPTTPGDMTATIGGEPLLQLTLDSVSPATKFTAVVPPHAAGSVAIAVTTAGGTFTAQNMFTYSNGVTVTPKTAPNGSMTPVGLDITGVGFSELTFGTTYDTNSNKAHVYLVKGSYDPTGTATKANGQVAGGECLDVMVIGDTNLICNAYLGGNLAPKPTATTRTVSSCASQTTATSGVVSPTATVYLGPSSGTVTTCTFTPSDVGMKIVAGTTIPDNTTTITAVSANGVATLSKVPAAPVTSTTTAISLSSERTAAATDLAVSGSTLTPTSVPFGIGEVGKMVTGTNIPLGTYITALSGNNAVLSNAPTGTLSGTLTVYTAAPIPIGTYTVTVVNNGALGAQTIATYKKSIISSGSTFTVADY